MLRPGTLGQADDDGPVRMQAKQALKKAEKDARARVMATQAPVQANPALEKAEKDAHTRVLLAQAKRKAVKSKEKARAEDEDEEETDFSFKANRGRIISKELRKNLKIVDRNRLPQEKSQSQKIADKVREKAERKRLKQAMAITAGPEADEKTKNKIEKIKKRIHHLREKQADKRKRQLEKWGSRPDVLVRWRKRDEAKRASHDRKLAHWIEKDEKEAARQAKEIEKIKTLSDFEERKSRLKAQWARRDARIKSARAHQEEIFAEQEALHVRIRELGQRRRDQMYNFVGQFVGWPQRPLITPTED